MTTLLNVLGFIFLFGGGGLTTIKAWDSHTRLGRVLISIALGAGALLTVLALVLASKEDDERDRLASSRYGELQAELSKARDRAEKLDSEVKRANEGQAKATDELKTIKKELTQAHRELADIKRLVRQLVSQRQVAALARFDEDVGKVVTKLKAALEESQEEKQPAPLPAPADLMKRP